MCVRKNGFCILTSFLFFITGTLPMVAAQNSDTRLYLDRIKVIRNKNDADALQRLITDIETEWRAKKDADYYRVVLELCLALSSSTALDSNRVNIARKLAAKTLDAPGEKPIDSEVRLVLFLQSDPEYTKGILRGNDWKKERLLRVHRWSNIWQHLRSAKSSLPAVSGPFQFNVMPPPGEGVSMAGMPPEKIKDPVRRKKYEEAIARNTEIGRIYQRKRELQDLEKLYIGPAKRYISDAYSKPPLANDELEKLLTESDFDASIRADIMNEVKKKVAARMEREAKEPSPPRPRLTEPIVPPDAPSYHADSRLRVKVSFDLQSPMVDDVLRELRQATKVNLSRADNIQTQYASHGSLSYRVVPAWQVMDDLAKSKRVEGRWEKDGDGYRLVRNGNPLTIPEASEGGSDGSSSIHLALVAAATLVVVLGLVYWRLRRDRPRASNTT